MSDFKNTTVISISGNSILLNNDKPIDITFVSHDGVSNGYIVSSEIIHSALVEYLEKHSLKASSTSFCMSGETTLENE